VKETVDYQHMPILRPLAARPFVRFWASGGSKVPEMGDALPRTPLNHHAKFDAANFVLAGEIRNRTNKQKQTVIDISTPIVMCG